MKSRDFVRIAVALLACLVVGATTVDAQEQRRRGFSVAITEPANQQVVFGKTKIIAEVEIADTANVDRVEFIVGDEVIFIDREPPYECYFDFGDAAKSWVVRAVAHHVEEVSVSDAVITRRLRFSTVERVNRVILWISATDNDGNFVTDLEKDDLKVYEDGVEQNILEFYREDRPITMAILIDSSGSMLDKLTEVHQAAAAFVKTLRPEDRALVIDFDDKVFLIQDLTSDHDALREAITTTEAIGGTAIYDVLHAAYRKIGRIEGRKAVILLSDGEDTASQFGFKRVLEEAKTNSTMIYTIGIGTSVSKGVMKEFADVTGGRFFGVNKASQLGEAYQQIADELRAQYYVAYSTSNDDWDGRWIKIKAESSQPKIKIRARRGYFAVLNSMLGR